MIISPMTFYFQGLKPSTSSDDLSPRSSPKKSLSATLSNARTDPKEMLKVMFDVMATDMSAFRVLYNLEVSAYVCIKITYSIRVTFAHFTKSYLSPASDLFQS